MTRPILKKEGKAQRTANAVGEAIVYQWADELTSTYVDGHKQCPWTNFPEEELKIFNRALSEATMTVSIPHICLGFELIALANCYAL
jgi:hypothetical protein